MALQQVALSATKGRASVAPDGSRASTRAVSPTSGSAARTPNPMFTGMMAVDQLGEIGLRPGSNRPGATWSRPALTDPAPVAGTPRGLAMVPAAVTMLRWKLQRRDR